MSKYLALGKRFNLQQNIAQNNSTKEKERERTGGRHRSEEHGRKFFTG